MPFASFLSVIPSRVRRSLFTWPDASGWRATALAYALFALFSLIFGFASGFFTAMPTEMGPGKFLSVMAILFVFPGIAEELVFRGIVLPHPSENRPAKNRQRVLLLSIVIFVLYHVANAWLTFPVARPVFWDWRFLVIVAALAWACGSVYLRTASLWPAVLIHWSIVVIWKAWLGGPVFFG